MKINYVHCFIAQDQQFLMLRRNNPPFKNMWNCVGGKMMPDETPREAVIREVKEETGLDLQSVQFKGIATWNQAGGMYIFVADQFTGDLTECTEGTLAWKSKEWIMQSPEVVSSIRTILDDVLATDVPVEYALFYTGAEYEGELWKYVVFGNCEHHDSPR
ncbi:NUDIX hydrolase [Paenibacillus oleatilyticus]|uniref:NUDIX hydrolase n=1 Tax=Paenibacillus oleatilyticus TaxID=2594886 RepID=UPI0024E18B89|nr:8-oxo-dGTP diphosphatase [Paenibacillus oleatilyticus]